MLRCWKSNVEDAIECYGKDSQESLKAMENHALCMRPTGHSGPHRFVSDELIIISIKNPKED